MTEQRNGERGRNYSKSSRMRLLIPFHGKTQDGGIDRNANGFQIHAGRKGRTVQDCLVNLQLSYKQSQVMRSVMAIIFSDMAGCYDRIRMNLNTITSMRMGMSKSIALTHAKTLTGMEHRVRTAYGDSEQ